MTNAVICSITRTPIGQFSGAFTPLTAMDLGSHAIAAAAERSGLPAEHIDEVLFGHVLKAGQGQITARQAARSAGIPMSVPATTINKVCLSGMTGIAEAARHIQLGESTFVMAGGMESMTMLPMSCPKPATACGSATERWSIRCSTMGCGAPSTIAPWAPRPTS